MAAVLAGPGKMQRATTFQRFLAKVVLGEGCWEWTGATSPTGYGQIWNGQRVVPVHRWIYEFMVAPIPEGMEIDHLCRVRNCTNPGHMEPVTHGENLARAIDGAQQINRAKTHCPRGHEYTPANTRIGKSGSRFCLACQHLRNTGRL